MQWYTDTDEEGQLQLISSAPCDSSVIREDGTLVLMQEQDKICEQFFSIA